MRQKLVLLGAGGHCKVVIDAIKRSGIFDIYGILDPAPKESQLLNIPVIGPDNALTEIYKKGIKHAFIAVGSIGNCAIRRQIYENLINVGFNMPVIRHPHAIIADNVEIKEGSFIAAGAVINPGTKIGKNVIVNTQASIDHDCHIGDFVHIAPGVTLSGEVKIGNETHIGTGANIVNCIDIGKNCFISAGLTVADNMEDNARLSRGHE